MTTEGTFVFTKYCLAVLPFFESNDTLFSEKLDPQKPKCYGANNLVIVINCRKGSTELAGTFSTFNLILVLSI